MQSNNPEMNQLLSKVLSGSSSSKAAIRVYLIRHGETNWNLRGKIQGGGYDVPLNDTGRSQARKAAQALEGIPLDIVASSSLSRAKETADILFENHQGGGESPLRIVDAGFNEMRFGQFEGYKGRRGSTSPRQQRFLAEKKKVADDPEYCFPSRDDKSEDVDDDYIDDQAFRIDETSNEGESTRMVEDRVMDALSKTIAKLFERDAPDSSDPRTKNIAIVSHGRTNKIFLASMISGDGSDYKGIGQSNVNISVLDHPGLDLGDGVETTPSSWKGGWTSKVLNYTDHVQE